MMIRKNIVLALLAFCIINPAFAQDYFQQEVNYKIEVSLNDSLNELFAKEKIEYINNSPDTLHFLWFHIWPNAYSNNKTAFWEQTLLDQGQGKYFDYKKNPGYIDSLDFKVNEQKIKWEYHPEHVDICKLILNKPLLPGKAIKISTPFHVKIPDGMYSRMGHERQAYQITQWFPKPAVYDKYGWHEMPYLNRGEFYSEYGSFDVSITLPANYVVGASGNLQTYSEIQWLNKKAAETRDCEVFSHAEIPSSKKMKTIRYTEKNIHDFAWFADKNYYVLKSEVSLPKSGRSVTTWAMFTANAAKQWKKAPYYINDAIYYYSLWNGEYPYNNCTAVEGALSAGAGMEYPEITIIGTALGDRNLEEVIMHEVGHNWFYGIFGFNERRFPYLDEGINTFNQLRYINTKYHNPMFYEQYGFPKEIAELYNAENLSYTNFNELLWLFTEREGLNQPISTSSEGFTASNYGLIAYFKTAQAWNYLRHYLGDDEFDRINHLFYDKWKYKHPYPEDIRKIFEENSDKDLSWFFEDVLNTDKTIDYEIETQDGDSLLLINKGKIKAPFQLASYSKDKLDTIEWEKGFTGKKWIKLDNKDRAFCIDPDKITLDVNRLNNCYDSTREYLNIAPVKFQFPDKYEESDKYQIFYAPVIGINALNGLMFGPIIYNNSIPEKRMSFMLMPLVTTDNSHIAGIIRMSLKINKKLSLKLHFKQFGRSMNSNIIGSISYRRFKAEISYHDQPQLNVAKWTDYNLSYVRLPEYYGISSFINLKVVRKNNDKLNPHSFSTKVEIAHDFLKASFESRYRFNYGFKNKSLDLRIFAGIMDMKNHYPTIDISEIMPQYNPLSFSLNGISGAEDYQYDNYFINRDNFSYNSSMLAAHQFVEGDGGFAIYAPGMYSNKAMLSVNLKTSVPKTNLIKLYANIGIYKQENYATIYYLTDGSFAGSSESYWFGINKKGNGPAFESGIELRIIPDIFSIYFPILLSKELKEYSDIMTDNYFQKLRFTLYLNKLDPAVLIKKAF